jgi:hypothetical protein
VSLLLEHDASGRRLSPRLGASSYSGFTELLPISTQFNTIKNTIKTDFSHVVFVWKSIVN